MKDKDFPRIDVYMVEKGLAPSRTRAQDMIREGVVSIKTATGERQVKEPSEQVQGDEVFVRPSAVDRYVSRGGLKLEGALKTLELDVQGFKILDVGMSTGGFTDCLLQNGAESSVGIEVGHGQLNMRLQAKPNVKCLEGVNVRNLSENVEFKNLLPPQGFDLTVVDVSFISLETVIPAIVPYSAKILALVKPQFEVGPQNLSKGGIVKDSSQFIEVEKKIRALTQKQGLQLKKYFESLIKGRDGNQEFFFYAEK